MNSRFAVFALLVTLAAPAAAQNAIQGNAAPDSTRIPLQVTPVAADSAAPRASAIPTVDRRAAAHYNRSAQPAAPMKFAAGSQTQPVALMIVGGAALLAGALIEGDAGKVFMVGGAVIGLIGLYQYLQ